MTRPLVLIALLAAGCGPRTTPAPVIEPTVLADAAPAPEPAPVPDATPAVVAPTRPPGEKPPPDKIAVAAWVNDMNDATDQMDRRLVDEETAAYQAARPVFAKYCASCHQHGGKNAKPKSLDHFDMTSYPFGGHHARTMAAEIRRVLGATGKKATMPKARPGSVKGDELALILAWADAYDVALAAGAATHSP